MIDTQQHSSGAFAKAPEHEHHGAAPEFSFNDELLFSSIDEEALLSSVPMTSSGTTTTIVGTVDDLFSSPEWTDPSPALTTSMSFNLDSCDTSPLLTDVHEAPELAGMPLFGDQVHFPTLLHNNNQQYHQTRAVDNVDASGQANKRSPQMAFSRVKEANEQSALLLLRAFNNQALINNVPAGLETEANVAQATASPAALLSPLPAGNLIAPPSTPLLRTNSSDKKDEGSRGQKRRLEATDLLPLNAPIQARTYKTPSATSRKSSGASSDQNRPATPSTPDLSNAADPVTAKRLSNTLAARRSRHRKAEELRQLHDTIEDLQQQVEVWKRRCMRAEDERNQALGQA